MNIVQSESNAGTSQRINSRDGISQICGRIYKRQCHFLQPRWAVTIL